MQESSYSQVNIAGARDHDADGATLAPRIEYQRAIPNVRSPAPLHHCASGGATEMSVFFSVCVSCADELDRLFPGIRRVTGVEND